MSCESFSFNVKEEISKYYPERECCRESLLASMLFSMGKPAGNEENLMEFTVTVSCIARLFYKLLKEISGKNILWETNRENFLLKRKTYQVFVPDVDSMREFIDRWGITDKLHRNNIRRACCRRAFLTGAFLTAGSINSPKSYYHFEIVQRDPDIAQVLVQILNRMEVGPKIMERRGRQVVYLKKADEIANLLNILGAHSSLLKFEEVRAIKETKKDVCRRVNAEISNLDKTIRTATRQAYNIRQLQERGILGKLPQKLKNTADLRLRFPDASLKELGQRANPPVKKSTINSRLRKIERIARTLENEKIK